MVFGASPQIVPPYPALPSQVIRVIEQAICVGLGHVKTQYQMQIPAAPETQITSWLSEVLALMWQSGSTVSGFDANTYQLPHLDATVRNFDGTSYSGRPDLRFYLQGGVSNCVVDAPYQYAWFCECKLLDSQHSSQTLHSYITQGVQRFEMGQYAWAMPHAQMLAYVREPHSANYLPSQYLVPRFQKKGVRHQLDGNVVSSTHARLFSLANGKPPGNIELRHLWFKLL